MKKHIKYTLLSVFILTFLICSGNGITTEGKRFWVSFMDHNNSPKISLIISTRKQCNISIVNPNTQWSYSVLMNPNDIHEVVIPYVEGYVQQSDIITQQGLLVTSTDTISLYASSYTNASFDITGVLPENALADEYMTQSYPNISDPYIPCPSFSGSNFLIVATEDNTTVDITPTEATTGGHLANIAYSVNLNQGETYQVHSCGTDLSGSVVKARNKKKIAVFNGNKAAYVPKTYKAADHLFEQTFPIITWGKQFAITAPLVQTRTIIRVTASSNQTEIYKNNTLLATINKGETLEYGTLSSESSYFLETSEPCMVYLYVVSFEYGNAGDPSMVIIPPIEQGIKEITFSSPNTSIINDHYLNIVTTNSSVASLELDGTNISSSFSTLVGKAGYSFARISISSGTHTLKGDDNFIAYVYGLGTAESYAYSAGSSVKVLTADMYVNDIPSPSISLQDEFCINDTLLFEARLNYIPKSLNWKFSDGNNYNSDTVKHVFKNPGIYLVELFIEREETNPPQIVYDTISVSINVVENQKTVTDSICDGDTYYLYGKTYTKPGTYYDTIPSIDPTECDTILILNLKIQGVLNQKTVNDSICEGDTYYFYGKTYTQQGIYYDTIPSIDPTECDTALMLNLKALDDGYYTIDSVLTCCADDDELLIPHSLADGIIKTYSLQFGEKEIKAGFVSFSQKNIINNELIIPIPQDVRPDRYTVLLTIEGDMCNPKSILIHFTVNYSHEIIAQKWNDVLALYNPYYNGGYEFSDYQWYKNGVEIDGATRSYVYFPEELDFSDKYSARVTRVDDGVTFYLPVRLLRMK